jgi:hypothetical protein
MYNLDHKFVTLGERAVATLVTLDLDNVRQEATRFITDLFQKDIGTVSIPPLLNAVSSDVLIPVLEYHIPLKYKNRTLIPISDSTINEALINSAVNTIVMVYESYMMKLVVDLAKQGWAIRNALPDLKEIELYWPYGVPINVQLAELIFGLNTTFSQSKDKTVFDMSNAMFSWIKEEDWTGI